MSEMSDEKPKTSDEKPKKPKAAQSDAPVRA